MNIEISAQSPGLILGSADTLLGANLGSLDLSRLERAQLVSKFVTGSPSLLYDIRILESFPEGRESAAQFGIHLAGGLVVRDGYEFMKEETAKRQALVRIPDGYYSVDVFVGDNQDYGRMRLDLLFRKSEVRVDGEGAVIDYIPP